MFEKLQKQDTVKEEGDVIYSGILTTNAYDCLVDHAYVDQSDSGAAFMQLSLITDSGKTLSQRFFFTSGDAKGNAITYPVKDKSGTPTGEQRYLPGFVIASDIHEMLTGVPLAEMTTESKLVKVWNKAAQKELPVEKPCLINIIGKRIKLGIQEQEIIKQVNDNGTWKDTDETRKQNEVVKVFDVKTGITNSERIAGEESSFLDKWIANFEGIMVDKTKGKGKKAPGTTGATGVAGAVADAEPAKQQMFG